MGLSCTIIINDHGLQAAGLAGLFYKKQANLMLPFQKLSGSQKSRRMSFKDISYSCFMLKGFIYFEVKSFRNTAGPL